MAYITLPNKCMLHVDPCIHMYIIYIAIYISYIVIKHMHPALFRVKGHVSSLDSSI